MNDLGGGEGAIADRPLGRAADADGFHVPGVVAPVHVDGAEGAGHIADVEKVGDLYT